MSRTAALFSAKVSGSKAMFVRRRHEVLESLHGAMGREGAMAPKNGWYRWAWLVFASGLSLLLGRPTAAEITHLLVTASSDIGPFRGKGYREVQATMEGVAPGGPYSVPVVLAFPKAAGDSNGFALLDVFNTVTVGDPKWVTGGRVFPMARGQLGPDYVFGSGNFYVGVLWDKVAAEFLRTGTIAAASDGYEILRDASRLARNPAAAHFPAGFTLPRAADTVIAYGYSQSGMVLRGFYFRRLNTAKGDLTFDGALIVGARGLCWHLDRLLPVTSRLEAGPSRCDGVLSDGGKVIAINPETDVEWNGFNARGETADYRVIEVAGVSHVPVTAVDFRGLGVPRQNPVDALAVFRAALTNLQRWLRGTDPPPSVYITLQEGPAGDLLGLPLKEAMRDADGNALGGVRLPHLPAALAEGQVAGAPLGTYKGLDLDFKDTNGYFLRSGSFAPFSEDRLRALYPNPDAYVSAVSRAAKDLVVKRYILQEDADKYIEAAARSTIGR
jgi:Alpha/beta hydrolase domain